MDIGYCRGPFRDWTVDVMANLTLLTVQRFYRRVGTCEQSVLIATAHTVSIPEGQAQIASASVGMVMLLSQIRYSSFELNFDSNFTPQRHRYTEI